MSTRLAWMFAGLGFSVAVGALVAAAPAEKPKTAWEYKFVTTQNEPPDPAKGSDSPNEYGADGWELVSATVNSDKYVLYYKAREVAEAITGSRPSRLRQAATRGLKRFEGDIVASIPGCDGSISLKHLATSQRSPRCLLEPSLIPSGNRLG